MYNNKKIGVGIVTCNRKDSFKNLFKQIKNNNIIDFICVVKNKDYDYADSDPFLLCNEHNTYYKHIKDNCGVGFCKNTCLKKLLDEQCDYLFIIEDDIHIKNDNVFAEFIKVSEYFNIEHLNWNNIPTVENNKTITFLINNGMCIDFNVRLCGCFSFFTRNALQYVGLLNDKAYVNALEHAEHAYRFSLLGFAPPFFAFPSIHDCHLYLEDTGMNSTIDHESSEYRCNLVKAYTSFKNTYGKSMKDIQVPTTKDILNYIQYKIAQKYNINE